MVDFNMTDPMSKYQWDGQSPEGLTYDGVSPAGWSYDGGSPEGYSVTPSAPAGYADPKVAELRQFKDKLTPASLSPDASPLAALDQAPTGSLTNSPMPDQSPTLSLGAPPTETGAGSALPKGLTFGETSLDGERASPLTLGNFPVDPGTGQPQKKSVFGAPLQRLAASLGVLANAMNPKDKPGQGAIDFYNAEQNRGLQEKHLGLEEKKLESGEELKKLVGQKNALSIQKMIDEERARKAESSALVGMVGKSPGSPDWIKAAQDYVGAGGKDAEILKHLAGAGAEKPLSDIGKLLSDRDRLAKANPNDPNIAAYDAEIKSKSQGKETVNDYQTFYRGFAFKNPGLKGGELDDAANTAWHNQKMEEDIKKTRERGMGFAAGRPYSVMDTQDNNKIKTLSGETLTRSAESEPGRYVMAPPTASTKTLQQTAAFNEIETSSNFVREAIKKLPGDFSQAQIAKFANVLKIDDDGGSIRNFLDTNVAKTLSGSEIDYVTAVMNLRESAYALRTMQGMGQGSDDLRRAIAAVIPGPNTPNKQYAFRSLDLFDTQVAKLRGGIPTLKGGETKPTSKPLPESQVAPLISKYFPADQTGMAMKVLKLESGLVPGATNTNKTGKLAGTQDSGLFQINDSNISKLQKAGIIKTKDDLKDPDTNAKAAGYLFKNGGWSHWRSSIFSSIRKSSSKDVTDKQIHDYMKKEGYE